MRSRLLLSATLVATLAPLGTAQAGPLHRFSRVVERNTLRARAAIGGAMMKAVGYAELAGLHISVHRPYQAQVSSGLWRGSRIDDAGLADLKARGFSAVVGLTAERDLDAHAREAGLPHLRIPIIDNHTPTLAQVRTFLDYVRAHASEGPVYVHCEAGVGRTGIMVAAYRMAVQGWPVGKAVVEARKYGMVEREQIEFIRGLGRELSSLR